MRPGEDELRRLYVDEGLNCADLGRRFGVARGTVRNWLVAAGVETRAKPNEKYPGDTEIRRLYVEERKSLRQIAAELDTHIPVVSRWLKRAGVQSRSVSEGTSLAQTGRPLSEKHREALGRNIKIAQSKVTPESQKQSGLTRRGRPAPNKGKKMSEEQRQKLIAAKADPEYRQKMSEMFSGDKTHLWKGGKTPDSSLHGWRWRAIRREVYERDRWLCQDCGQKCLGTKDSRSKPKLKIQAHHIVSRRNGGTDDLANLVTLCMSCHQKRERASVPESV